MKKLVQKITTYAFVLGFMLTASSIFAQKPVSPKPKLPNSNPNISLPEVSIGQALTIPTNSVWLTTSGGLFWNIPFSINKNAAASIQRIENVKLEIFDGTTWITSDGITIEGPFSTNTTAVQGNFYFNNQRPYFDRNRERNGTARVTLRDATIVTPNPTNGVVRPTPRITRIQTNDATFRFPTKLAPQ